MRKKKTAAGKKKKKNTRRGVSGLEQGREVDTLSFCPWGTGKRTAATNKLELSANAEQMP
jgi:hypothetical protein